jgi:hypothetical protein
MIPFYLFVLAGICLFLYLTIPLNMDVMKTYTASYHNGAIISSDEIPVIPDKVYAYNNRNEKVYSVKVINEKTEENKMILQIADSDRTNIEGLPDTFSIDVKVGEQSLFSRIFEKAGKSK